MRKKMISAVFISGLASSSLLCAEGAPADTMVYSQAGEITDRSAILWARCNSEQTSRLIFRIFRNGDHDYDGETHDDDRNDEHRRHRTIKRIVNADSDYTATVKVSGLRDNTRYYYQASCQPRFGRDKRNAMLGPVSSFTTAAETDEADEVRFVWMADLAGQGWGRNPELLIMDAVGETIKGGYVIFDVMSKLNPDFAVLQGDMIYADNPIPATKVIPDDVGGGVWTNDPTKDFTAIDLDAFRANWKYNFGDPKMAAFLASTPVYVQWDDHEVTNNWYPGEIMPGGDPYYGIPADVLAKRSRRALFEYNPIEGEKIYRKFQQGKHMELFLLDERSYRGPNPENYNPDGIEMLGRKQLKWLKKSLKRSKATWKVISTHDPLGIVTGGPDDRDSWSQDDDRVLGRELQLAEILKFIKDEDIKNVVFLTADVHFTAAIAYDPARATFTDFEPFWEFVIGPINAGAFGPGNLDRSFGPRYEYVRAPGTVGIGQNAPPPYLQSFGAVHIDQDGDLTVQLIDITGVVLYEKTLSPQK